MGGACNPIMFGLGVDVLEKPSTGARNKRNRVTVGEHDAIAKKLKIAEDKLNDERASHSKTKLALVTADLGLTLVHMQADICCIPRDRRSPRFGGHCSAVPGSQDLGISTPGSPEA